MTPGELLRKLPSKVSTKLAKFKNTIFASLLERKVIVRHQGKKIFSMRNYTWTTEKRARTFETKEPETLRWIDGFSNTETLMDIGANVGVYTLYAAYRGHKVVALEPDALNFALLNLNIKDNNFSELSTAYPFSLHRDSVIAELHMQDYNWGGSQKSFGRSVDWQGKPFTASFSQGSAGISVDEFVAKTGNCPNHMKIDVDGNETLVLEGAPKTLVNPKLKSLLIELYAGHEEYEHCVALITNAGFTLNERVGWAKKSRKNHTATENHIFYRTPA